MIVYGRAPMMFTNYCPLKVYGQCGKCKKNSYVLKEEYGEFPIISHEDCTTTILNGKILNLINDIDKLNHINTLRINLTLESYDESLKIIEAFKNKLNGIDTDFKFNNETDTRGHFNKEIL
jgi:putative protease